MQKTKLGISVGAFGAILYFVGIFNTTALILLAGFVLLMETNPWLRKAAVKAVAIVVIFMLLSNCVGFINDILAIPNYIIRWFDDSYDAFQLKIPLSLGSIFVTFCSIAEFALLAILGLKALKQGDLPIAPIDKTVAKSLTDDK